MKASSLKNHERTLKWEKRAVEKRVEELILKKAEDLIEAQIDAAMGGSIQAGQYLIDRTFGKARQNIGLDGGVEGTPVVFMPSTLINKFALNKPIESNVVEAEEVESKTKLKTYKVDVSREL